MGDRLSPSIEPGPGSAARTSVDAWSLALACTILALSLAVALPAIAGLGSLFRSVEFYGHAYLVPVVAGYLVLSRRRELLRALRNPQPPALGWLAVLAAGTFEVLMIAGDVGFAAGVGIALLLGASAWAVGGVRLLRPLALPLTFLVLMIPPPRFVLYELLPRLKLMVTSIAVSIMQWAGATVVAEGNQILLPEHTLFVADACSGLTSVVTMLPIACTLAYFLTRGFWRRAVVVGSVVPLAMAGNVVRVIVTVKMVEVIGGEAAQGLLHESFGVATYAIGTLALVGIARMLR
jgi:exosortase